MFEERTGSNDALSKIYDDLQITYNKAMKFLKANEHDRVIKIFSHFFKGDLELKEKIASILTPKFESADQSHNSEKIEQLTVLGSYYSNFHFSLFEAINDKLVQLFKKALQAMELDMEEGSRLSFNAQKIVRLYEIHVEKLMAPIDTYQGSMYTSLRESYKIVQQKRDQNIAEITKMVISKEAKLREQMMN